MTPVASYRLVAYMLATLPVGFVHRRTLRAMLPVGSIRPATSRRVNINRQRGSGSGDTNRVSDNYRADVHRLARKGLIERGQYFLRIIDRDRLLGEAVADLTPEQQFELHNRANRELVVATLREEISEDPLSEVNQMREWELAALELAIRGAYVGEADETPLHQPEGERATCPGVGQPTVKKTVEEGGGDADR